MANAPSYQYVKAAHHLCTDCNLESDTLTLMLLSAYTVGTTLADAEFIADITGTPADEVTGDNGYTSPGQNLANVSFNHIDANDWPTSWANGIDFQRGAIVKKVSGNGRLYQCIVGGTSGGTEPTWTTTVGEQQPNDGSCKWTCIGIAATVLLSDDVVWTQSGAADLVAVAAVLYDNTVTSDPVISYVDLGIGTGGMTASNGGTLTVEVPTSGWYAIPAS